MRNKLIRCKRICIGRTLDGTVYSIKPGDVFKVKRSIRTKMQVVKMSNKIEVLIDIEKIKSNFITV